MFNFQTKVGNPELRGRSTGSMVTNFGLGITFSHKILVKVRRASASISLKDVSEKWMLNIISTFNIFILK